MEMNREVYQTKDLYEASALYALNLRFLGLKREWPFCWFIFEDKDNCQQIADEFWAKKLKVDPKCYAEAIRTLKDRIFARN